MKRIFRPMRDDRIKSGSEMVRIANFLLNVALPERVIQRRCIIRVIDRLSYMYHV